MNLRNTTHLDSSRLKALFVRSVEGWPYEGLDVFVRYSRGAEFSGVCYYQQGRIHVNLGRNNTYPFKIDTMIARPESNRRTWWRELYSIRAADAYQLVLFVFLHEFYHWLVKKARRNVRQKEARCDRFATRVLVDCWGASVQGASGRPVPRDAWDFQDLDGFVAAARRGKREKPKCLRAPAAKRVSVPRQASGMGAQLFLFSHTD